MCIPPAPVQFHAHQVLESTENTKTPWFCLAQLSGPCHWAAQVPSKKSVQKHFQYCKDACEFCRPAQANVGKTTAHILVGWTLGIWPIRRSTARWERLEMLFQCCPKSLKDEAKIVSCQKTTKCQHIWSSWKKSPAFLELNSWHAERTSPGFRKGPLSPSATSTTLQGDTTFDKGIVASWLSCSYMLIHFVQFRALVSNTDQIWGASLPLAFLSHNSEGNWKCRKNVLLVNCLTCTATSFQTHRVQSGWNLIKMASFAWKHGKWW